MTQQAINNYFSNTGYTPGGSDTWVDVTGDFTFTTGPDELKMAYTSDYVAVIKNNLLTSDAVLESWITRQEQAAQDPSEN